MNLRGSAISVFYVFYINVTILSIYFIFCFLDICGVLSLGILIIKDLFYFVLLFKFPGLHEIISKFQTDCH